MKAILKRLAIVLVASVFGIPHSHAAAPTNEFLVTVSKAEQDYNNDGVSDLAVYGPSSGMWYIQNPVDNSVIAWALQHGYWGAECLSGDFDGDGFHDPAVYDPRDGRWYIRRLDGTPLAWGVQWGFLTGEPVVGDFNGDGADDLGIYGIDTGRWYVRTLAGQILYYGLAWGYPGVEPYAIDPAGVGIFPAVYDPSGMIHVLGTPNWRTFSSNYKYDSELVMLDIDADTQQDAVLFYYGNGWFPLVGEGQTYDPWWYSWGFLGSVPVSGDYNGDTRPDIAVYGKGCWYVITPEYDVLLWSHRWGHTDLVPVGRRMPNPVVDKCELRVVDEQNYLEIDKVWLEDLKTGAIRTIKVGRNIPLLEGWYRITIKWRGLVKMYLPVLTTPSGSGEPVFLGYEYVEDIESKVLIAKRGQFYKFKRAKDGFSWELEEK